MAALSDDAFAETGAIAPVVGLSVSGQTVNSDKIFVGGQVDTRWVIGQDTVVTPFAWRGSMSSTPTAS